MPLEYTEKEIIKQTSCPSLSGKSELTYSIAKAPDRRILIRIDNNDGGGKFNSQWIAMDTILELLDKQEEPFSWAIPCSLFTGKSVNTAGFIMAALLNEGLIKAVEGGYECTGKKPTVRKPRKRRARC